MHPRQQPTHRDPRPDRRDFLKQAAVTLCGSVCVPYLVPSAVLGAQAPSNRLRVGFIGNGNQSTIDLPAFLEQDDVQVVAVCDVNTASYGYRTPDQFLGTQAGPGDVGPRATFPLAKPSGHAGNAGRLCQTSTYGRDPLHMPFVRWGGIYAKNYAPSAFKALSPVI